MFYTRSPFAAEFVKKTKADQIDKLGKANPYSATLNIQAGRRGKPGEYSGKDAYTYVKVDNPYYKGPKDVVADAVAAAEAKNAAFKASQEEIFKTQQADIAKQLKIVQEEKSAVSKLSQEYSDMLIKEAEAKRKAQEQERIALRTDRANLARAGQRGSLQIQPAGSTPRTTAGTQQFRRRATQFSGGATGTPYTGLSTISSGMVNV
jgi:hypothetical protein